MALINKKLTDLTEKTSVPDDAWVHFVDPNDISQSPEGSSYKAGKRAIISLKQKYNATTNTPNLENGIGGHGDMYQVSVEGERDFGAGNIRLEVGDIIAYSSDDEIWFKFANNNQAVDLSDYYDKSEVDALLVGLWDDRGIYTVNASGNINYPSSGGSGTAGALLKGDIFTVGNAVAGTSTVNSIQVNNGDTIRALVDSPGATNNAHWAIAENNIGYTPQQELVSGTNIKTVNGSSLLGSGDLTISTFKIASNADTTSVTGTTATVLAVGSLLIPANTFATNNFAKLIIRARRTVSVSGNSSVLPYLSPTSGITLVTDPSLVALNQMFITSTNTVAQSKSEIFIKNATNLTELVNYVSLNDDTLGTDLRTRTTIDWTVNQYLYIFVQNNQTTTSTIVSGYKLSRE